MTIYFNLSTSHHWRRHVVGIVRVERELASYLRLHHADTCFCRYHAETKTLRVLAPSEVDEILDDAWCEGDAKSLAITAAPAAVSSLSAASALSVAPIELGSIKRKLARFALDWLPPRTVPWVRMVYGRTMTPRVKRVVRRILGRNAEPPPPYVAELRPQAPAASTAIEASDIATLIGEGDIFVSVGCDWDFTPVEFIYQLKRKTGCRTLLTCYDTIPLLLPEFAVGPEFEQRFKEHFVDMGHTADGVFAISDCSRRDLLAFWNAAGLAVPSDRVRKIALASLKRVAQTSGLTQRDLERMEALRASGPYVIYVSTVEGRKNHRLLVDLWKEFHRRGEQVPRLICVGMRGWGVDNLLAEVERSKVGRSGEIQFWSNVNDALLDNLYASCLFGVFPSLYEGWGLAATELLAHGKVCVVSNSSSLQEAGQGLCPSYHPHDYLGWREEILKLSREDGYRQSLEESIAARYTDRSWTEFSADFSGYIQDVIAKP
jgi:glycosyltransferase involved in cell wall biosynthesis